MLLNMTNFSLWVVCFTTHLFHTKYYACAKYTNSMIIVFDYSILTRAAGTYVAKAKVA